MSPKEIFKDKFIEWASDKNLDQIADKVWDVMSTTYDLCKAMMLEKAFDCFVKQKFMKDKP